MIPNMEYIKQMWTDYEQEKIMMQAGSGIPGPPHLVGSDYDLPTLHKIFYNTLGYAIVLLVFLFLENLLF